MLDFTLDLALREMVSSGFGVNNRACARSAPRPSRSVSVLQAQEPTEPCSVLSTKYENVCGTKPYRTLENIKKRQPMP